MISITTDITAGIARDKIGHGLVFGKFMPPTNGHLYLLDFARQSCDKLTIIVLSLPDEPIPGDLRYRWIRELYPDCTVIHHTTHMPQEPKDAHDVPFYHAWRDTIRAHCADHAFDALFASETYGYQVAWALGIRFIPVNTARDVVEISGTALRQDPWTHWEKLHPVVRPHFLKRVALVGGDDDMRRTIARTLATDYRTVCVGNYATTLMQDFARNIDGFTPAALRIDDISTLARGHGAGLAALERQANRVLFADTELHSVSALSQKLFNGVPDWVVQSAARQAFDHYLILSGADTADWQKILPQHTYDVIEDIASARKALLTRLPAAI